MKRQFSIKSSRRHLLAIVIFIILAALLIASCAILLGQRYTNHDLNNKIPEQRKIKLQPKITSAHSHWLFMGDIFFGRYIDDWSEASKLGVKYPFQNLGQFERQNYNAWIANFECPSVAGLNISSAAMDSTLTFNCDPKYLPEAAKWFTAVSLGNNHTENQGVAGFKSTMKNLAANNIQYFGAYDPRDHDNSCNVIVLDATVHYNSGGDKTLPLPFGFCGYNAVFKVPLDSDIAEITRYSRIMPTFVMPHMGTEYQPAPGSLTVATYRKMIDAGAEMVIGNHPHWVQPTESYHDKLIVYSMGNFIFDQQMPPEKTRSALIDVDMTIKDTKDIEKWSSIAESCRGNFETCEKLANDNQLSKISLEYKFDVKGSNDGNKIVRTATPNELPSIKQRLNWDQTMSALGQ